MTPLVVYQAEWPLREPCAFIVCLFDVVDISELVDTLDDGVPCGVGCIPFRKGHDAHRPNGRLAISRLTKVTYHSGA